MAISRGNDMGFYNSSALMTHSLNCTWLKLVVLILVFVFLLHGIRVNEYFLAPHLCLPLRINIDFIF